MTILKITEPPAGGLPQSSPTASPVAAPIPSSGAVPAGAPDDWERLDAQGNYEVWIAHMRDRRGRA